MDKRNINPSFIAYKTLADALRKGKVKATRENEAECERLRAVYEATQAPQPRVRSVFDLPIARVMWEADARQHD